MGTPDFAVPSLEILFRNNYAIPAVVTAPEKPRGRGQKPSLTPIAVTARNHGIPLLSPHSLKDSSFIEKLVGLQPDLMVVVAFRILPPEVFTLPRLGAFNLHASLLPRYRGAAPINHAIMRGENETGVTTFLLKEKVDTGNILLQARVPIGENDNAGSIHDRLAEVGAEIVLHTVRLIEQGKTLPRTQDDSLASPAPRIFKNDCRIDWSKATREVHDFIRGLSPYPAAFSQYQGKTLKFFRSDVTNLPPRGAPGEIFSDSLSLQVSTGDGVLSILEIQQEGKKRMPIDEFLRGYHFLPGSFFS